MNRFFNGSRGSVGQQREAAHQVDGPREHQLQTLHHRQRRLDVWSAVILKAYI